MWVRECGSASAAALASCVWWGQAAWRREEPSAVSRSALSTSSLNGNRLQQLPLVTAARARPHQQEPAHCCLEHSRIEALAVRHADGVHARGAPRRAQPLPQKVPHVRTLAARRLVGRHPPVGAQLPARPRSSASSCVGPTSCISPASCINPASHCSIRTSRAASSHVPGCFPPGRILEPGQAVRPQLLQGGHPCCQSCPCPRTARPMAPTSSSPRVT